MRRNSITTEFYGKLFIAAFMFITGCATTRPAPTTVYLVRHAEKSTAVTNDPDPVLTPAGRARANALAIRLANAGITNVISTQWSRARETARPLAALLSLNTEIVPTGDSAFADSTAAAVLRHRGGTVLVVGHSNTIPSVISALGGPRVPDFCDNEYSKLFVMWITKSQSPLIVRQAYGVPDPAPDSACNVMRGR